MSSSIGIAGSSPFQLHDKETNELVKDAIASKWDTDVSANATVEPIAANILFITGWVTSTKDIEIIFRSGQTIYPSNEKSIGGGYEGVYDPVYVHIFARGLSEGIGKQPANLTKAINGLKTIVRKHRNDLIPNHTCTIMDITPGRLDVEDNKQNLWHKVMQIRVTYYEVQT